MTAYTPRQWRRYTLRTILYVALIVMTLVFLLPIYLVVITSVKNPADINLATAWLPPTRIYWESFQEVLEVFGPRLRNSGKTTLV